MTLTSGLLLLLLALLLPPSALATKVSYRLQPCPLDGAPAKVYSHVSANSNGGYDSDLCSYSTQGQWREYAIATCPQDLYTLLGADFSQVHDEATTRRPLEVPGGRVLIGVRQSEYRALVEGLADELKPHG